MSQIVHHSSCIVDGMSVELSSAIAAVIARARRERGWSIQQLAGSSGVSRAMISKIERDEVQPTAVLLGRLSAALGLTLSDLLAEAEAKSSRVVRAAEQHVWIDPGTGYRRRAVTPGGVGVVQIVDVELPVGAAVPYPADSYRLVEHRILVLDGVLTFVEGDTTHVLEAGDCLQLGAPADCVYRNDGTVFARYLVILVRRP
jgi:transcriptional regulator with XRE-family HTH domain